MKFRYLIIHEDYTITGTNEEKVAMAAVEFELVVDVQEGKELTSTSLGEVSQLKTYDIPEETTYQPA